MQAVYPQAPQSWLTVSPLSGTGPGQVKVSVNAANLVPGGIYRASLVIVSDASSPQYQRVTVQLKVPAARFAVVNGGSFASGLAPGMLASVFDAELNLATGTAAAAAVPLPYSLAGTTATVNGIPAPLFFASPTQLNIQIPFETSPGIASVEIHTGENKTATGQILVNPVAPGIFLADGKHVTPNVAVASGGYATIYLTGQGPVTPAVPTGSGPGDPATVPVSDLPQALANVSVYVNGVPAQITFAGVPYGLVGVVE